MNLTHRKAFELLQRSIDGTLDAGDREELESHLTGCTECQIYAALYRRLEVQATGMRSVALPSENEIQRTIRETQKRFRRWYRIHRFFVSPVRTVAWVAAAVTLAVAVVWIFEIPREQNQSAVLDATPTAASTATPTVAPTEVPSEEQAGISVTTNVPYSDKVPHKLDVYAPTEEGTWPVVLVLHGCEMGMYTKGDPLTRDLSVAIAEQGAVVYTVAWLNTGSLSGNWGREPVEEFPERLRYWSDTLSCAIRYARATAADYGGDPEHVTVFGPNCGAQYGLLQALVGDEAEGLWDAFAAARGGPAGRVGCQASDGLASVEAFVGYGAPYTVLEYLKGEENEWLDGVSPETRAVFQEAGAELGQDPELWEIVSPFARIGDDPSLKVRFIQGELDSMVGDTDLEMNALLLQALVDAGYDATLTVVPDGRQLQVDGESGRAILAAIAEVSGE